MLCEDDKKYLERIRVDRKLDVILFRPVIFVTAPMGYGKTTAVSAYLKEKKYNHIWIDMHRPVDIAPEEYFLYLLTNEIRKRSPDIAGHFEKLGFPGNSIEISQMLELMATLNPKEDIIIVFDNYCLIENDRINQLFRRFIFEKMPWLHFILIARQPPNIGIQELFIKGCCEHIDIIDLTLSPEEALEYFQLVSFEGRSDIRQQIIELSNGWFPVVYVLTQGYNQNKDLKDATCRLLKSLFFDNYSPSMKQLLMELSLFDSLTTEQVVYIFETSDIISLIEKLCYENPYCSSNGKHIFIINSIYKDLLVEERIKQCIDTSLIAQRAANWFSTQENQLFAVQYWHLLRKYELILYELEHSNQNKMSAFDVNMMVQSFNTVSRDKIYDYPIATLKYIFYHVRYGDMNLAKKMIVDFKHHFDQNEHPKYTKKQLFAEVFLICSVASYNNAKLCIYFSRKAYDLLAGGHSLILNRNYVIAFGSPHFSGSYHRTPGTFKETVDFLASEFFYHVQATNGMAMGCEYLCQAEYMLETGDFENVERMALQSVYKATSYEQKCITVSAKMTLARLFLLQGRKKEVDDLTDELIAMQLSETDPANLDVIDNCIGYINATLKNDSHIPAWLYNIETIIRRNNHQGASFNLLILGRLLLNQGEFLRFDALFDIILSKQNIFQNQLCIIHCYIQKSIADYHNFGIASGICSLQKAVDIALQDDIRMPFIEYALMLHPMLRNYSLQIPDDYRDSILTHASRYNLTSGVNHYGKTALSSREVEVLALIEKGYSNAEISETLCISAHTVKRHIQNSYAKLGVNNKIAAINKLQGKI